MPYRILRLRRIPPCRQHALFSSCHDKYAAGAVTSGFGSIHSEMTESAAVYDAGRTDMNRFFSCEFFCRSFRWGLSYLHGVKIWQLPGIMPEKSTLSAMVRMPPHRSFRASFHLKTACCVPQKLRRTAFVIISRNFLPGAQSDLKSHQASFVLPRLSSGKDEESCEKINLYLWKIVHSIKYHDTNWCARRDLYILYCHPGSMILQKCICEQEFFSKTTLFFWKICCHNFLHGVHTK